MTISRITWKGRIGFWTFHVDPGLPVDIVIKHIAETLTYFGKTKVNLSCIQKQCNCKYDIIMKFIQVQTTYDNETQTY